MTHGRTRLLVLCIDAASPELLDAWIADGSLPNLAALAARGVVGRTRGLDGFFVGSTWPSLFTGTSPAQHGFHYQLQLLPGTYRIADRTRGTLSEREPFWRALGREGKRVALLDVPLGSPEGDAFHGVQVVEWGAHDAFFGFSARPTEVARRIETAWGRHPAGVSCDVGARSADQHRALVAALEAGAQRKTAWTIELLEHGGWDLFMQVFSEAHCVGHQCWHLHDAGHPAHDAALAAAMGDPLRSVYRAIDRGIGEIVGAAGDATCIVFTAHGMSYRYGAHFVLRDVLVALGATVLPRPTIAERAYGAAARVWDALPAALRRAVNAIRPRRQMPNGTVAAPAGIGVDTRRSRCFPLSNGLAVSGIRINLAGREPDGVIQPGSDEASFVSWLTAELLQIVDETTGAPLVARVIRTSDVYTGEHIDQLPDLLVEWSDRSAHGSTALGSGAGARVIARSPRIGRVEGANDYARSGEHRPGGWFLAVGAGLARGRVKHEPSLLDLAPTFAAILGVSLPQAEGTPISELVTGIIRDGADA